METLIAAAAWVSAHPEATIQLVFVVWALANVVWAQWPRPHSERGQRVWRLLHSVFGLVATHTTAKGTFTWPTLLRGLIQAVTKLPSADPFEPVATPDRDEEAK